MPKIQMSSLTKGSQSFCNSIFKEDNESTFPCPANPDSPCLHSSHLWGAYPIPGLCSTWQDALPHAELKQLPTQPWLLEPLGKDCWLAPM